MDSINNIQFHILPLTEETWLTILASSNSERPQFKIDQGEIHVGQVIARFLGVPIDEDEYYNRLYDLIHSNTLAMNLLTEHILDHIEASGDDPSIQRLTDLIGKKNLPIEQIVYHMDEMHFLVASHNPIIHRKIREALIETLLMFSKKEEAGLTEVVEDIIKWSFRFLEKDIIVADPKLSMPKFMWYGDFKKNHSYFVYFLVKMGCDLLVFSPSGKDVLASSDYKTEQGFVYRYPAKRMPLPFPMEIRNRKSTIAYKASKEIEFILNHDGSGLYKPWQLRDYMPHSVTLKTTYDEIFLIMREPALVRPNFEVKNGIVRIPCVFAKIQGVSKNRKEYWNRLHDVAKLKPGLFIKEFPLNRNYSNDFRFHYKYALDKDGFLSPEKMIQSHYWKYRHLPLGLQKGIGNAIRNICTRAALKPIYTETVEDVRTYLFNQGMQIPENILKLLQQFDYSQAVPKLVLYNNELNGIISRADCALLLLLNELGMDIVVYNPAGESDIENYIEDGVYDIHWLEDVVFEQEYKEPSLLRKITYFFGPKY